jgi:pimeloyl-ACP methyl ester carboxylesterase
MGWRTSCHGKGICKPDPYGYAFWGNTARRQVSKYPTELYKPDLVIGWSLGGLLALEIASVLSQASALIVVGIVMVDSIFPGALKSRQEDVVPHPLIMSTFCKPEIRMLVANMMKTSAKMVEQWIMPSWTGHATSRRRWNSPLPDSNSSTDSEFMSDNEDNGDLSLTIPPTFGNSVSPPTILLRCEEFVPVPSCGRENAISRVDVARERDFLGWEEYEYDIIYAVLKIPGHHFNVFSEHHVSRI